MYTGLTDIDQQGNIVPGIAESWDPNKELTSWVFRLRKGVLFHNGREVDAEAVKLNILRIKDPAIGSEWAPWRGGHHRERRYPRQIHGAHSCDHAGRDGALQCAALSDQPAGPRSF
jgi:ABC-type transport system substrate-binding protein